MPIYVCYPGVDSTEPWFESQTIFAAPFDSTSEAPTLHPRQTYLSTDGTTMSSSINHNSDDDFDRCNDNSDIPPVVSRSDLTRRRSSTRPQLPPVDAITATGSRMADLVIRGETGVAVPPDVIRKVRHSEIVIVDDVCIQYSRYWLRLRWPGRKGGFAGYIPVSMAVAENYSKLKADAVVELNSSGLPSSGSSEGNVMVSLSEAINGEDREDEDPAREETASMPPSEPFESEEDMMRNVVCRRTGIPFPSTNRFKLLPQYDDGVIPSSALPPFPTEPVFCRICREGLHEEADGDQPAGASDEADPSHEGLFTRTENSRRQNQRNKNDYPDEEDDYELVLSDPTVHVTNKGPVYPHPTYAPNPDAQQNPILAPCECSGSMAFVHYLCVEQWRCRSRHPDAANGLNCETCGTAYSLAPPTERQLHVPEQDDWLDAMPPHVLQALRQPHIWWQIGASIVRRRWLRPIAPIVLSPTVALYCRARRLLKKRGVARRRWACSLCRRRARWKCVRCLRSYYCSRQCQNVSWHIIHKHVCYKPARFWWSVVVYGGLTVLLFPGILRDPLMYDIGVCLILASFVVMGILGGGIASSIKRVSGVDARGRMMEMAVVLATIWLSVISWGLVKGFFGNEAVCYGTVGSFDIPSDALSSFYVLRGLRTLLLRPAERIYLLTDRLVFRSLFRSVLCSVHTLKDGELQRTSCFEHLPNANADFFLAESNGGKCSSDLLLVAALYVAAGAVFAGSSLWKHHERHQRRRHGRRPVRLHGD